MSWLFTYTLHNGITIHLFLNKLFYTENITTIFHFVQIIIIITANISFHTYYYFNPFKLKYNFNLNFHKGDESAEKL